MPSSDSGYDVVVVGAGIVGSAIARMLAGYQQRVALIEARDDVGDGTSKANTAILHTGFDAKPGTLESRMVARGYHLLSEYAAQTGIPVERTGALLVAWTEEELAALPALRTKAADNGYTRCEIVDAAEVYRQVPHLGDGALGGLTVPDESIICTWTTNLALATDAVNRGAHLLLGRRVDSVEVEAARTTLHTGDGPIRTRWVVNAAGQPASNPGERLAIICGVMMVFAFTSNFVYALVGSLLRQWLAQGTRLLWFNRTLALVLVLTAYWMLTL